MMRFDSSNAPTLPVRQPAHASALGEGAHSEGGNYKEQDHEADEQDYRLEEGDGGSHAQRIVGELYHRYERQLQRWRDYRNLAGFLLFVALYLGVLYCQRGSETAFKVHSTIEAVVVPSSDELQSTNDVYSWMQNLLSTVWQDPVCGDGICEVPFEYASYSTFGCRADCGKLSERQNLTVIQVDLYYDFTHPVGSIPSSELMAQAAWNLCPLNTPYSTSCYYSSDNTFSRLAGEVHQLITDSPDGQWDLVIKLDIFDKVQGAVRQYAKVMDSAYYYKVAIAALAARTEQNFEMALLQNGSALALTPYWTYVTNTLLTQYPPSNVTFLVNQMLTASCACVSGGVLSNTSDSTTAYTSAQFFSAFNNSVDARTGLTFDTTMPTAAYTANYCPGSPVLQSVVYYSVINPLNNVTTLYNVSAVISASNATALSLQCNASLTQMLSFRANQTLAVQLDLLDLRLGDGATTGKFAQRVLVQSNLRSFLTANFPELVAPVFTGPTGLVLTDPVNATLAVLLEAYVEGPYYLKNVQQAYYNLARKFVYDPAATLPSLSVRALARIAEVRYQQNDTFSNLLVPLPQAWALNAGSNQQYTVGQVFTEFVTAGLTTTFTPDPSTPLLNDFQIVYNLANWTGNTTAYTVANLDLRGASYIGNCSAMPVSCTLNTNAGQPYNCTNLLSAMNETISGNLSDIAYRNTCETPCDRKLDCNTVCECYGTCGLQQFCTCPACTGAGSVFALSASADSSFLSVAATSSASTGQIAGLGTSASGRRLQQATEHDQLAAVLTQVGTVQTSQGTISSQMTALQAQVAAANVLAVARAKDQTLINLIQTGNQEIQTGQAAVQAQLGTIIGEENAALQLAQQAATTLSSIQNLATQQLTAQAALASAVQAQLQSIRIATSTGTITIAQALAIYKRARRDQAATNKAAILANIPCNPVNIGDNLFNLTTNGNVVDTTSARERNIGLTNRVIGGMLVNQWRSVSANCTPDSKFAAIQDSCYGARSLHPYGVDPVFKPSTTSYNPSFDDATGTIASQYYNCAALPSATYNVTVVNGTTNQVPFCAELFNPEGVPYAFHSFPLQGKPLGFPVYFDINLGGEAAQAWFTYVQEGLYLDTHTEGLSVQLVTYNAPLRMFGYFEVIFNFGAGGSIDITHSLYTVCVELYATYNDKVRFAFEIMLNMAVAIMSAYTCYCIFAEGRRTGSALSYFTHGWNLVNFISDALLLTTCIMWWVYVAVYAKPYEIALRYDVYPPPLQPQANFLALYQNGTQLGVGPGSTTLSSFDNLAEAINLLNWYFALNGINILLLIARVLKLMDFQPRLGVVTRSLWLAGPDLVHFAIVAGFIFISYAMMAHLIFGNSILAFRTFGAAINTCFEMLLGNIDVNGDLRALGGLQSVAGIFFFWSYELLVFLVLLNFLLAIIVDAFSEVKSKTSETIGIPQELFQLLRDKARNFMTRFGPDYISDDKLGSLLKSWAGDNGTEGVGKANEVALVKVIMVMNKGMDEAKVREAMGLCCAAAKEHNKAISDNELHGHDPDGEDDAQKGGKPLGLRAALSARFVRKPKAVSVAVATDAEIHLAAEYLVQRLGTVPCSEHLKGDELRLKQLIDGDSGNEPGPGAEEKGAGGAGEEPVDDREKVLEEERAELAGALCRLAEVQRELAEGQRSLMAGQRQLADQQGRLVVLMSNEAQA